MGALILFPVFGANTSYAEVKSQTRTPNSGITSKELGVLNNWGIVSDGYTEDNTYVISPSDYTTTGRISYYDYNFSIPGGSTIQGIELSIVNRQTTQLDLSSVSDISVYITPNANDISTGEAGTNNAVSYNWYNTPTTYTYGNNTDLWGQSLTVSDINSTNFGVIYEVSFNAISERVYVDTFKITVYYI